MPVNATEIRLDFVSSTRDWLAAMRARPCQIKSLRLSANLESRLHSFGLPDASPMLASRHSQAQKRRRS
jgi:hypothetical protein